MSPAEIEANERRAIVDICDLARRIRSPLRERVLHFLARAGAEDASVPGVLLVRQVERARLPLEE